MRNRLRTGWGRPSVYYRPDQPPYLGHYGRVGLAELGDDPGGGPGYNRAPFLVELNPSGARGVPLTALRRLEVAPSPAPPAPEAQPKEPSTDLTRFWPYLFAPYDSYPITRASALTTLGVGATLSILSIGELPRAYRAVIKKFGQTASVFDPALLWTFLVKGIPKDPILGINYQFGALNLPTDLPGPGVILEPGDDFVVSVTNNSAAIISGIRARVDLYWWPIRSTGY